MAEGNSTLLSDLVDLEAINREREVNEQFALADRDFGIANQQLSDVKLLRRYVQAFDSLPKPTNGHQLQSRSNIIGVIIAIIGLISGYFTSVGLLQYDGTYPVNLMRFIAVLFFIQMFSLTTFLIGCYGLYSDGMAWFINTFSISTWISRIGLGNHDWLTRIPLAAWQAVILTKSQIFIALFFLGALIGLLYQSTISDIAFGWSTTLDLTNEAFLQFCQTISAPWSTFVPGATVDAELIDATRYFRLQDQNPGITDASTFGRWWPFLAMTILIWGMLPRIVTWIISFIIERRALKRTLVSSAFGQAALGRMRNPVVTTQSPGEEADFVQPPKKSSIISTNLPAQIDCVIFSGSFSAKNVVLERLSLTGTPVVEIGAHQSIKEDEAAINSLRDFGNSYLMIVKAWEPPIMDTIDNIENILGLDSSVMLSICPVAADFSIDTIKDYHFDAWQQAISRFPSTRVRLIAHV